MNFLSGFDVVFSLLLAASICEDAGASSAPLRPQAERLPANATINASDASFFNALLFVRFATWPTPYLLI